VTNQYDDRDEFTIKVFRDDPAWDAHEKWWMIPSWKLNELYIGTYIRRGYGPTTEASSTVKAIREQHPGCVLVY